MCYAWAEPWPDWRHGNPDALRERLNWPIDGVLFDVEHNGVWHPSWGERPGGMDEALRTARRELAQMPRKVPVYGHRFLPAGRGSFGHPVLSMWKTDIICYGTDLVDYINREFDESEHSADETWSPQATVSFWRDFL